MVAKLPTRFTDPKAARKHLEALNWPDGPICPHCGALDRASAVKGGRDGLYFCGACRTQYTVTVGTVFERSKIPLHVWLYATHLLCSSKKGISGHQLSRMLGVTYKTAWFMAHRIREAMAPAEGSEPPLGGRGKIVEADETYLLKSHEKVTPKSGGYAHKMKVVSLVERGGKIRSKRIKDGTKIEMADILAHNVNRESILHTDGSGLYTNTGLVRIHEAVDHNKAYVRDGKAGRKVHTNTLEGFFSIFKRGMVGTYQHCGEQHLERYLAEFDFRMNHRVKLGYSDDMRTDVALAQIKGKRLTYRRPHAA